MKRFYLKFFSLVFGCVLFLGGCANLTAPTFGSNQSFIVPISADFESIAPNVDVAANTKSVLRNMHMGLLKYDVESKQIVNALAEEMTVSEDALSYTFTLKSDAKFHNGEVVTGEDVKYSFERLAGRVNGMESVLVASIGEALDSVEVLDEQTVVINFNEGMVNTKTLYDIVDAFIIPATVSEEEQATHPIGAGPYEFVEYVPGEKISFKAVEGYFEGDAEVKEATFKIFGEGASQLLAFQAGEINLLTLSSENYDVVSQMPEVEIYQDLANDARVLFLNHEFEPFSDIRVRQAINMGINKQRIVDMLTNGQGETLDSHMSPYMSTYLNTDLVSYEKDVEQAKALLKEAGYENLSFTLNVVGENQFDNDMSVILKEELAEIGVEMTIEVIPWAEYLETVYRGHEYEAATLQVVGYPDPYRVLSRYGSESSGNMPSYKDARIDELLELALNEYDVEIQADYYKEIQQILHEQAVSVFLLDQGVSVALSKEFEGYLNYPFANIDLYAITYKK